MKKTNLITLVTMICLLLTMIACKSEATKGNNASAEKKSGELTVSEFIKKYKESPESLKEFEKNEITIQGFDEGRGIKVDEDSKLFLKEDANSLSKMEWITCKISKDDTKYLEKFNIKRSEANKFTVKGNFKINAKELQSGTSLIVGSIEPCKIVNVE